MRATSDRHAARDLRFPLPPLLACALALTPSTSPRAVAPPLSLQLPSHIMQRLATAVSRALGRAKTPHAPSHSPSAVALPTGESPGTSSSQSPASTPSSRLDQALADIAAITAEARKKPVLPQATVLAPAPPSPLAAVAASEPVRSRDAQLLLRSNRELNEALGGRELAELAQMCSTGSRGVARDIRRASMLWVLAANKGHAPSILLVGIASMDGFGGIPRDEARAYGILSQICDKAEQPWAHFALATLLIRRHLAPEPATDGADGGDAARAAPVLDMSRVPAAQREHTDCTRALASYRTAANGGLAPAWLNVANCLAHGVGLRGGRPDPQEAARWLKLAAERGDPMAAAQYAHALSTGGAGGLYAVEEDTTSAAVWWRAAAVAGHPGAAHNLGVCYMRGTAPGCHGKPDPAAALVWFRRAGEAGVVRAAMNAGLLLERGAPPGLRPDLTAAHAVFEALEARLEADTLRHAGAVDDALAATRIRRAAVSRKLSALARAVSSESATPRTAAREGGVEGDEGADAELVLDFQTPEARDEAFRLLHANPRGVTGAAVLDLIRSYARADVDGVASASPDPEPVTTVKLGPPSKTEGEHR
jgi:TPR repeat protein